MSLGGFEAVVKIVTSKFSTGFYNGAPFSDTSMELEGSLIELRHGNLDGCDARFKNNFGKKTWVLINVKFTEKQEIDVDLSTDEKQYIGGIYYDGNEKPLGWGEHDEDGKPLFELEDTIIVRVDIILPCYIFSRLLPMEGRNIRVQTIHDVVRNPDNSPKRHHLVALIKEVHFEIYPSV